MSIAPSNAQEKDASNGVYIYIYAYGYSSIPLPLFFLTLEGSEQDLPDTGFQNRSFSKILEKMQFGHLLPFIDPVELADSTIRRTRKRSF